MNFVQFMPIVSMHFRNKKAFTAYLFIFNIFNYRQTTDVKKILKKVKITRYWEIFYRAFHEIFRKCFQIFRAFFWEFPETYFGNFLWYLLKINMWKYYEIFRVFSRISGNIFRDKIFCDICGQANAARRSALKMAGKFRRERTCEHMFIRREIFLVLTYKWKLKNVKFWFTLQFRWVLAFKEVILVSITNSKMLTPLKKLNWEEKSTFIPIEKLRFPTTNCRGSSSVIILMFVDQVCDGFLSKFQIKRY